MAATSFHPSRFFHPEFAAPMALDAESSDRFMHSEIDPDTTEIELESLFSIVCLTTPPSRPSLIFARVSPFSSLDNPETLSTATVAAAVFHHPPAPPVTTMETDIPVGSAPKTKRLTRSSLLSPPLKDLQSKADSDSRRPSKRKSEELDSPPQGPPLWFPQLHLSSDQEPLMHQ